MFSSHLHPIVAVLAVLGSAGAGDETRIGFERMANELVAAYRLPTDGIDFDGVLASSAFVHVPLGSFDLVYPVSALEDAQAAEEFEETARTMLDLQEIWFQWRGTKGDAKTIAGDWDTLGKWVKSWSPSKLRRVKGGNESLYVQLDANEKVLEAQARLRGYTRPPQATRDAVGDLSVIVLAPTRKLFIELMALGGRFHPPDRESLWNDNAILQTTAWVGWTEVVAMEYPELPVNFETPFAGAPMTARDKTGQMQYMADRGAAILLRKEFWRQGTQFFEESLGANLVIATVGRNGLYAGEWNSSFATTGAKTNPYERFVPGGNPGGGTLPKRNAGSGNASAKGSYVSRYRTNDGVEYFVEVLREGQKAGAKLAAKDKDEPLRKDKTAHFHLGCADSREGTSIAAPFLGELALGKALPPFEYLDDYEDFFRAYRSAFFHWLRTEGGGSKEESPARFAELVAKHATRAPGVPLYSIVAEVYGTPMSGPDGSVDSLEWRFLSWLSKG